jgi:hypothetical protein
MHEQEGCTQEQLWSKCTGRCISPASWILFYRKDKRAQPGNLPKSSAVSEVGKQPIEDYSNRGFRVVPWFRRLVAGVSPRSPRVRSHVSHVRFVVYLRALELFPFHYRLTNAPYSSSYTRCSYQKGKGTKAGNVPKILLFRKSNEKYIHFFSQTLWAMPCLRQLVACL